jgi:hypothetical protein
MTQMIKDITTVIQQLTECQFRITTRSTDVVTAEDVAVFIQQGRNKSVADFNLAKCIKVVSPVGEETLLLKLMRA